MKKLMVMLGAVALAAGVQAAAINWGASNISSGQGVTWNGGKADTKGSGYAAYFFITASTAAADADYIVVRSDIENALKNGNTSVLSDAAKTATTGVNGNVSTTAVGSYGVTQADAVTAFMVVINAEAPANATQFAISTTKTANIDKGASANPGMNWTGFTAANAWQTMDVPEPTSGLLLLLGVAGLALRRRRA